MIEDVKEDSEEQVALQKQTKTRKKCMFCSYNIAIEDFPEHLQQVHGKDPEEMKLTCKFCKKRVFSMRLHLPVCNKATRKCPHCDKKFCFNRQLKEHIRRQHKLKGKYIHDSSDYQNCQ